MANTKLSGSLSTKKLIGLIVAVLVIAISQFMPDNAMLTATGMKTVGVLIAFLVILVTEALPVVVTSLIFVGLLPLLGVAASGPSMMANLKIALSGYSEPIVFFTLASFGIAAALTNIPLSKRVLRALLKKFGRDINSVLLAVMVCTAVISSIVSNVPTCAIFMAISLDFLKLYKTEEDRKATGKAFMIGVPVASMIGGMMTPAGSSINLLAISQLESLTGQTITFVQWMLAGIPLTIVMIPIAWLLITRIYKPVAVSREDIEEFIGTLSLDIPEKTETKEKKVIVIVAVMFTLWVLSSWISQINVMIVAILGCCVMFLPGIEVLDIKTFLRDNSWDAFFLVGSVISIANCMISNGVSTAIASAIPALSVSLPVLIAFTAVLIFVTLVIIPVASSMIPIMAAPLVAVATGAGVSPAMILLAAALCAGNCYLLPLDTVPLITYSKGYYSMTDMAKSTIWMQLAMVALCALWIPLVGMMVGF